MSELHPIRTGMANVAASVFETAVNPLVRISDTIASVVQSALLGGGEVVTHENVLFTNQIADVSGKIIDTSKSIGNALVPTGYALCFLFFLIALIELAMSERMTLEYFIKFLSKLVIGVAAISYYEVIFDKLQEIGQMLAGIVSSANGFAQSAGEVDFHGPFHDYVEAEGAASWLTLMLAAILFALPILIASFAITGVVYVIAFTWLFEFCVRGAFLPVALALLSDDGWRGSGGRYIRKYLGVCCQGAVMVAIGSVASTAMSSIATGVAASAQEKANGGAAGEGLNFIGEIAQQLVVLVGVSVASVSVMFKASSFVSDIFGG